jgi:hypothetical protein
MFALTFLLGRVQWNPIKPTSKYTKYRAARIILNISNEVDHLIALNALGWEPFKTEKKKAKVKLMYKLLNKMGPKPLIKSNKISAHMNL